MERIFLTDNERTTLIAFYSRGNAREWLMENIGRENTIKSINSLVGKRLLSGKCPTDQEGYMIVSISDFGKEYLSFNPKLKNPFSEKEIKKENNKNKWLDRLATALITIIITEAVRWLILFLTNHFNNS